MAGMAGKKPDALLFEAMRRSQEFRRCRCDFRSLTGLELRLVAAWDRDGHEFPSKPLNGFCALLQKDPGAAARCAAVCRGLLHQVENKWKPRHVGCHAGLWEAAVPVLADNRHVATLLAGRVAGRKPSAGEAERMARRLRRAGVAANSRHMVAAWLRTPVLPEHQIRSALHLLEVCSGRLADAAKRALIEPSSDEPQAVKTAKEFAQRCTGSGSLTRAAAENSAMSRGHFTRVFRRATGMTYTEYVTRVRIERAVQALARSKRRHIEIAAEAGFGSLSQFNRAFMRYTGRTPTGVRQNGN